MEDFEKFMDWVTRLKIAAKTAVDDWDLTCEDDSGKLEELRKILAEREK